MARGPVQIAIIDGGNVSRSFLGTSDLTGNLSGNLSFVQFVAGADQASPASAANPVPVVQEGNITLAAGTNSIGSLAANQTVQVTNTPAVTLSSGNVTLLAGTASVGNIGAIIGALPTGTNSLGNIATVTTVTAVTAITNALPAGANALGNITSITNTVNANVTGGNVTVAGTAAGNATVTGNPVQVAYRAVNVEAVPNGNNTVIQPVTDLVGKTITSPYANKENMVRGTASVANTTTTTIIAAQGSGNKTYVTNAQLFNSGNVTVTVTFNDSASTVLGVPAGGGSNPVFDIPLVTAANTAFNMTSSANTTTLYCSAQGYKGT